MRHDIKMPKFIIYSQQFMKMYLNHILDSMTGQRCRQLVVQLMKNFQLFTTLKKASIAALQNHQRSNESGERIFPYAQQDIYLLFYFHKVLNIVKWYCRICRLPGRFLEQRRWRFDFWRLFLFWRFAYRAKNSKHSLCVMKLSLPERDVYCLWYCANLHPILGINRLSLKMKEKCRKIILRLYFIFVIYRLSCTQTSVHSC